MELKSYDKPWLPAFKGAFLILFGILLMLRIFGTIKTLGVLFIVLIGMMAFLLLSTGILFKRTKSRTWTLALGVINLIFCVYLGLHMNSPRITIFWIILIWVIFYAVGEIIEAVLLFRQKNACAVIFLQSALLTLLFGYFMYVLINNFTSQAVFYLGIIAFVIGVVNELGAYLLSSIKEK
jgi:uncharacterized membrane protein HdeD (DUF308 family)